MSSAGLRNRGGSVVGDKSPTTLIKRRMTLNVNRFIERKILSVTRKQSRQITQNKARPWIGQFTSPKYASMSAPIAPDRRVFPSGRESTNNRRKSEDYFIRREF